MHLSAMNDDCDAKLCNFVLTHPRLMVLTGAGVSTAAGLGDYRDKNGQWKREQPITGQLFISDETARKRYWARSSVGWPAFDKAEPALSHHALRRLQLSGHADLLVTQNVDSLHQKAGHESVVNLHGVLATVSCIRCKNSLSRNEFQSKLLLANPWLSSLTADYAPDGDADLDIEELQPLAVPSCEHCTGLLKPDVVFFGESVPKQMVSDIMQHLARVDALLIVGSSLMVYSGYRFCKEASRLGKPIAIVNHGVTRADELASLRVDGDCGAVLDTLAGFMDRR